ncbi:MAG: hypothetical protein AB1473_14190 [Thermodesulfobacteriota bacterium]
MKNGKGIVNTIVALVAAFAFVTALADFSSAASRARSHTAPGTPAPTTKTEVDKNGHTHTTITAHNGTVLSKVETDKNGKIVSSYKWERSVYGGALETSFKTNTDGTTTTTVKDSYLQSETVKTTGKDGKVLRTVETDKGGNVSTTIMGADGKAASIEQKDKSGKVISTFKVEKDKSGNPVETSFRINPDGGTTTTVKSKAGTTYESKNADQKPVYVIQFDADGKHVQTVHTSYDKAGTTTIKVNPDGSRVETVKSKSGTSEVTKGPDGKVLKAIERDANGKTLKYTTTTYDKDGNVTTKTQDRKVLSEVVTDKNGKIVSSYKLEQDGMKVETFKINPDGSTFSEVKSKDGSKTETKAPDGKITTKSTGPDGKILSELETDKNGKILSSYKVEKDKSGNTLETRLKVNPDGSTLSSVKDKNGTKTEDKRPDGKVTTTVSGPDGKLVSMVATDKSGKILESYKVEKDKSGNPVETRVTYDAGGNSTTLTKTKSGTSEIGKSADGKLLGAIERDLGGKIVQRTEASYDSHGKLTTTITGSDGILVSKVETDKSGKLLSSYKVAKDKSGNPVETSETYYPDGKISATVKSKSKTSEVMKGADGKVLQSVETELDSSGRMVSKVWKSSTGDVVETKVKYAPNGNSTTTVKSNSGTSETIKQADGKVLNEVKTDRSGNITASYKFEKDKSGNTIETTLKDGIKGTVTKGPDGKILSSEEKDKSGKVVSSYYLKKDKSGDTVEVSHKTNSDGSSVTSTKDKRGALSVTQKPDGTTIYSTTGPDGKLLKTSTYEKDKSGGKVETEVQYRPDGSTTTVKDKNGTTVTRVTETAGEKRLYVAESDAKGQTIKTTLTTQTTDGVTKTSVTGPDGKLLSDVHTEKSGKVIFSSSNTYNDDGSYTSTGIGTDGKSYVTVKDKAGKTISRTSAGEGGAQHATTWDGKGGWKSVDTKGGAFQTSFERILNTDGTKQDTRISADGSTRVTNRDSMNREISYVLRDASGTALNVSFYTYDESGGRTRTTTYPDNRIVNAKYRADGKVTEQTWIDGSGKITQAATYTYDQAGQRTGATQTDATGKTSIYRYEGEKSIFVSEKMGPPPTVPADLPIASSRKPSTGAAAVSPGPAATKSAAGASPGVPSKSSTPQTAKTGTPPTSFAGKPAVKIDPPGTPPGYDPATYDPPGKPPVATPSTTAGSSKVTSKGSTTGTASTKTTTDAKASLKPADFGAKKDSGTVQAAKVQPSAAPTKQTGSTSTPTTTSKTGVTPAATGAQATKAPTPAATVKQTTPAAATTTTKPSVTQAQTGADTTAQKTTTQPVQTVPVVQPVRPPVATPGRK